MFVLASPPVDSPSTIYVIVFFHLLLPYFLSKLKLPYFFTSLAYGGVVTASSPSFSLIGVSYNIE
jgi:hypothetical protein